MCWGSWYRRMANFWNSLKIRAVIGSIFAREKTFTFLEGWQNWLDCPLAGINENVVVFRRMIRKEKQYIWRSFCRCSWRSWMRFHEVLVWASRGSWPTCGRYRGFCVCVGRKESVIEFDAQVGYGRFELKFDVANKAVDVSGVLRVLAACVGVAEKNCLDFFWAGFWLVRNFWGPGRKSGTLLNMPCHIVLD